MYSDRFNIGSLNIRRIKYERFITEKVRLLVFFCGLLLFLMSCDSAETEKDAISDEHAYLLGTWQEVDSSDTIVWNFDQNEVKWKGFTHHYEVAGDSLIISGLLYEILEQSDSMMRIQKLNDKACILNRKD